MLPYVKRLILCLVLGVAISAVVTEFSFLTLREVNRSPQVIELVIPPGTADQVARGEQPPTIPPDMIFIVGDELVVKNEDSVPHDLGPLFIPPGSSAHLSFTSEDNYSYSCSFQPSRTLGLDVRSPVTATTRIIGILLAGLPFGGLLAVYSIILRPPKKKEVPA